MVSFPSTAGCKGCKGRTAPHASEERIESEGICEDSCWIEGCGVCQGSDISTFLTNPMASRKWPNRH